MDDVDIDVEVHGTGVIEREIPNVVTVAYVEGSGDGGLAKGVCEPAKEKDAGKEMTTAPAPDMDAAPPVQDAEVSVGAADVEGCGDTGVARDVREEVKEKDGGKETTGTPAPDMEGAPHVQDVEVNVGDVDVEGRGDAGWPRTYVSQRRRRMLERR